MAVAFDAFSVVATGTTNRSWTHTPVGTPAGVIVLVHQNASSADQVSSVTYGGTTMTRVRLTQHSTGETGATYLYFLGASVPTGAQTVLVTVSGAASKKGHAASLTASTDTEVVDDDEVTSDSATNPSVTLGLLGRTCFCALVFQAGPAAIGSTTPLANWTSRDEFDYGNQVGGCYTYNTIGSTDVTAGITMSAEDICLSAIAVSEVSGGGGGGGQPTMRRWGGIPDLSPRVIGKSW